MWIMELEEVPYELQFRCRERLPILQFKHLHKRSASIYAVGSGRKLCFVLGVLSPTLLSDTAYLWVMYLEDAELSRGDLRLMKKVFPKLARLHGRKLAAETYTGKPTNDKFLLFLGFEKLHVGPERTLYEWG